MFRFRRAYFLILVFASITLIFANTSVAQGEVGTPENDAPIFEGDALLLDAQGYADEHGLELSEAVRRLQLQEPAGELNAELLAKESATFAGAWIQHSPEFRIIVQFTENGEATLQPYIENGPLAGMVEVRTADVPLIELEAIQDAIWLAIRGLDIPVASGINAFENRVELYVVERQRLDAALRATNIQLSDRVEIVTVNELGEDEIDIFAGLELSTCTSGFSVKNSSGTKGITTAAHCNNVQKYNNTTFPFQGAAQGGQYDVQWHTAPGFTVRNLMYDGTYYRLVYGTKPRNSQMLNEYVCKYGRETYFTCGYIINKNFMPACKDGFCYTSAFIRVHRDGVDLSSDGDSGGPWFAGSTAYGIHKGGVGNATTVSARTSLLELLYYDR
jgi:hypothetical protein